MLPAPANISMPPDFTEPVTTAVAVGNTLVAVGLAGIAVGAPATTTTVAAGAAAGTAGAAGAAGATGAAGASASAQANPNAIKDTTPINIRFLLKESFKIRISPHFSCPTKRESAKINQN